MKKLTYNHETNSLLIDIRPQDKFQAGHIKNSLNFIPSSFTKYLAQFLTPEQSIQLLVEDESPETLAMLADLEKLLQPSTLEGYLLFDEIPKNILQKIETISAEDFLAIDCEDTNVPFSLLDLRSPAEITRPAPDKHLTNIPLEELAQHFQQLDPAKTIYTLCGSGNRATAASSFLRAKGFKTIVIEGGMKAVQDLTY